MTAGEQADATTASPSQRASPPISAADLEAWLSPPRLDTYLAVCGRDGDLALELYCWNSQLAAAALTDTCHLEVALRNAYDRELCKSFSDWAVDPTSRLFRRTQGHGRAVTKQIELNNGSLAALTTAKRGLGANPAHGKVVAATSFGFWTKLTDHAAMESFFALLQRNVLDRQRWTTREQLRLAILTWIERTYHRRRRQRRLGRMTPIEIELLHQPVAQAA